MPEVDFCMYGCYWECEHRPLVFGKGRVIPTQPHLRDDFFVLPLMTLPIPYEPPEDDGIVRWKISP